MQRHGLPDDNSSEESNDGAISSPSSPGLVPQGLNDDQNDDIEDWEEPLSDTDMGGTDGISETTFNYQRFTQIELPPIYKSNFADLAWKACCNVSDNAYDQMKYMKDEDFWLLKICIKRLFDISRIETVDIDCCRKGKRSCFEMLWC